MSRLSEILFSILGSMVTLVVPAIVWTFLIAGCCQLVREQLRRLRIVPQGSPKLVHKSTS